MTTYTEHTNGTAVKEIMTTSLTATALAPFCIIANQIVTEKLTGVHDTPRLQEIARWMAAHFASQAKVKQVKQKKVGDASTMYSGVDLGKALGGSSYGQQVLLLDTSGILASLGKRKAHFELVE